MLPQLLRRRPRPAPATCARFPSVAAPSRTTRGFAVERLPVTFPTRTGGPQWADAMPSATAGGASDVIAELPGMPRLRPGNRLAEPRLRVTTLPNGLRVATQETYGQVRCCGGAWRGGGGAWWCGCARSGS